MVHSPDPVSPCGLVLHGRYGDSCGRIAAPTVRQAELTEVLTVAVQVEQHQGALLIASCSESCDS